MVNIPSIQDIFDNILADLQAEFNITTNQFGNAFIVALAGVLAGILWLVYLSIGDTQKNIWFDTADSVANGGTLERFGVTILGRYPFPAIAGQYTATVTGTVGAVIPGTSVFITDDSSQHPGMLFQIDGGDYTLVSSPDTITINALAGGLASRLTIGDTLTSTAPIPNVNSSIAVDTEVIEPVEAETIEAYRNNIAEKVLLTPGSWSAVDYRLVGTGIAGVLQTYAYADSGSSAVVNVFLQGNTPVANPGPSASPTVVSNYETALELVRPLGVWQVNYASSPINNIDIVINMGSFPPFTATQQADILSALTDFLNGVTPFIASADNIADRNDVIATYNVTSTITSAVPGFGFSGADFTVAGVPAVYWQADQGNIAFLNSVSFI